MSGNSEKVEPVKVVQKGSCKHCDYRIFRKFFNAYGAVYADADSNDGDWITEDTEYVGDWECANCGRSVEDDELIDHLRSIA